MRKTTGLVIAKRNHPGGFTLLEALVSICLMGAAVMSIISVLTRDIGNMTRNRVTLIAQTALRKRVEFRRLQSYATIVAQVPTCPTMHRFDNDVADADYANNADLRSLPYGRGEECLQLFERNDESAGTARLRRLTVITKGFERSTADADPNIRRYRALMVVFEDGVNRQP